MGQEEKLMATVLAGRSDTNIGFNELCNLLDRLGFTLRIRGDHFIFTKDGVDEIINLQPKGNKAKAYQVKQVRNIIVKYKLGSADHA